MRPLVLCCMIPSPLNWKGLEQFEGGRERQDFCFELS